MTFVVFLTNSSTMKLLCLFYSGCCVLLSGVSATQSSAASSDCKIKRNGSWKCKFDIQNLSLESKSILLTVNQDGRTITCIRSSKGELEEDKWYGSCDGDARDANLITLKDQNGVAQLFGSIHVGKHACQIAPTIQGDHEIQCTPFSLIYPQGPPLLDEPPMNANDRDDRVLHFGFQPSSNTSLIRGSDRRRRMYDDSGSSIDIMVVWTMASECDTNNMALTACTLNNATEWIMRGAINRIVAETNTAFVESGIQTQLRLVHAYRDTTYYELVDDSVGVFTAELSRLQKRDDGYLDIVHIKRALYGADLVALIAGTSSFELVSMSSSAGKSTHLILPNLQQTRIAGDTATWDPAAAICFPSQETYA
jgi:hypothetical protein